MAGDAQRTIERFWHIQDSRDYRALVDLFDDQAELHDPVFGVFRGKEAIRGFMTKMVEEMAKIETHFDVEEIAGDDHVAWARWVAVSPRGKRKGCGLYKVRNGKLTYYRDYFDPSQPEG